MAIIYNPNKTKFKALFVPKIGTGGTVNPGATPTPPSFTNKYSLNFDGVDDYTKAPINIDAYKVATIRSFNFWVKINTLNTFTPLISGVGTTYLFRYTNNFGINQGRLQWSLDNLTNHLNGNWIKSELVDGTGSAPNIADGNWHNVSFYNAVDSQANNVNIIGKLIVGTR